MSISTDHTVRRHAFAVSLGIFLAALVGALLAPACVPDDACLLHSDCAEGLSCTAGRCALVTDGGELDATEAGSNDDASDGDAGDTGDADKDASDGDAGDASDAGEGGGGGMGGSSATTGATTTTAATTTTGAGGAGGSGGAGGAGGVP